MFQPQPTFCDLPHGMPREGTKAAVLGVPYDCGIHPWRVGSREAPVAVRRASRHLPAFHVSQGDFNVLERLGAVRRRDDRRWERTGMLPAFATLLSP